MWSVSIWIWLKWCNIFRRDELFNALKKVFFDIKNENLAIYGIPQKGLKDYATSKKDIKKGIEVTLDETHRLRQEDIYSPKVAQSTDFG